MKCKITVTIAFTREVDISKYGILTPITQDKLNAELKRMAEDVTGKFIQGLPAYLEQDKKKRYSGSELEDIRFQYVVPEPRSREQH